MRNLRDLDQYRQLNEEIAFYGCNGNGECGLFLIPSPATGVRLKVIASAGDGWDHVSVSTERRTPNWFEMEFVRKLCFKPDEIAWQYHVPEGSHINFHPNCLHIWRKHDFAMPMPPKEFV